MGDAESDTYIGIVLKSHFLMNDNNVIIRKLKLSMNRKCLKNRIQYNFLMKFW